MTTGTTMCAHSPPLVSSRSVHRRKWYVDTYTDLGTRGIFFFEIAAATALAMLMA